MVDPTTTFPGCLKAALSRHVLGIHKKEDHFPERAEVLQDGDLCGRNVGTMVVDVGSWGRGAVLVGRT